MYMCVKIATRRRTGRVEKGWTKMKRKLGGNGEWWEVKGQVQDGQGGEGGIEKVCEAECLRRKNEMRTQGETERGKKKGKEKR
jgi:hypothetical protein